eukprot:1893860-Rhodomonas_salina.1
MTLPPPCVLLLLASSLWPLTAHARHVSTAQRTLRASTDIGAHIALHSPTALHATSIPGIA